MTYKELYESAIDRLEKSKITLGEFEEMIEPLNAEIATADPDTISRQAAIDTEGLDEQIRCEMCRNPMHTDRGCDGNCKYDGKLYERIMQILGERIKPLPSAQPEIIQCKDCKFWTHIKRTNRYWCKTDDGLYDLNPSPNDFCSRAERRTDE